LLTLSRRRILTFEAPFWRSAAVEGTSTMPQHIKFRFALPLIAAGVLFAGFCSPASAQDAQSQSVADAARQARAAKKNAKSNKVISDDDLDKSSYKPGAEGLNVGAAPTSDSQAPNAAAVNADIKADQAAVAAETTAVVKPGEDPAIARAKEELAAAAAKLDLLKRSNALDQDTYFSKPGYSDDHSGKSKLDAEQAEINDQQQLVDDLKARLADLKAEHAAKTGVADSAPDEAKKPAKPRNAGLSLPDKTDADKPASDQPASSDQPPPQSRS
jgi:hypothetical protein